MSEQAVGVLEGVHLDGSVNTTDETILANINYAIRRGFPQLKAQSIKPDRVCIVGGGPSLVKTEHELRDLYFAGAKIVTLNGAYNWCIEHNIKPSAQIILDARQENARFVNPPVPKCRYFIASQCHPDVWDAMEGRDEVWIWHAIGDDAIGAMLNEFYDGLWNNISHGTLGGTTVAVRAIAILRLMGFLRMDLFGVDSCWMGDEHHAFAQSENDRDKKLKMTVSPTGEPEKGRTFWCAPWHLKQLEDLILMIRATGNDYMLNIHGDGLLAFALQVSADVQIAEVVDQSGTGA